MSHEAEETVNVKAFAAAVSMVYELPETVYPNAARATGESAANAAAFKPNRVKLLTTARLRPVEQKLESFEDTRIDQK